MKETSEKLRTKNGEIYNRLKIRKEPALRFLLRMENENRIRKN